jgi:hypothetical protein
MGSGVPALLDIDTMDPCGHTGSLAGVAVAPMAHTKAVVRSAGQAAETEVASATLGRAEGKRRHFEGTEGVLSDAQFFKQVRGGHGPALKYWRVLGSSRGIARFGLLWRARITVLLRPG